MRNFLLASLVCAAFALNGRAAQAEDDSPATVESLSAQIFDLAVQAAKTPPSDKAARDALRAQIRALQAQRDDLIASGPAPAAPRRNGTNGTLVASAAADGAVYRSGTASGPVYRQANESGPVYRQANESGPVYRQVAMGGGGRGGAIAPNIGWFNNINQWNSGQARVPYIGKNGRVNFAGFSFGRNGISGPAFNATKFGGNFFGIPIRFKY